MGAGAEGACVVVSRRDGEAQRERGRDPEALRWVQNGRGDCQRARGHLLDDRACRGRDGVHVAGAREALAGDSLMSSTGPDARATSPGPPLWLLCELTYTCPLHCVFCFNPTDFARSAQELSTEEWLRVLRQGRE